MSTFKVAVAIGTYCLCSSSMLMVNKLAITHIKSATFVTLVQFSFASLVTIAAYAAHLVQIDAVDARILRYFGIYVLSFSVGTWANMRVLAVANVETVIVFRSCTPLAVCVFEYFFYSRDLPSRRSCAALSGIVLGTVAYVCSDREIQHNGLEAYKWAALWWVVLVFQLTFGKFLVSGTGLRSAWTPVLLNNTLSIAPVLAIGFSTGELSPHTVRFLVRSVSPRGWAWLAASCPIGFGISFAGFTCQQLITATSYTVVGVLNKMLTVLANTAIWDQHASPTGILSLVVCLLSGTMYQQAPMRKGRNASAAEVEAQPLRSDKLPA